jgi:cytochrome P450
MIHEAKNAAGVAMRTEDMKEEILQMLYDLSHDNKVYSINCLHSVGGSDTTSHTLLISILHVAKTSRCLQKLRDEIHQTAQDCELHQILSYTTLSRLPYLKACICETLRLDPLAVSYLPR